MVQIIEKLLLQIKKNSKPKSQSEFIQIVKYDKNPLGREIQLKQYTIEEVAKHNSVLDCWIIVRNKVYDITKYMDYHPGGVMILVEYFGKDCTDQFNIYHSYLNLDSFFTKYEVGYIITE